MDPLGMGTRECGNLKRRRRGEGEGFPGIPDGPIWTINFRQTKCA